jgi:Leucine-rich repeat (LRR) protein
MNLNCLEYLDISFTMIADLMPLTTLKSLRSLNLAGTPTFDLAPLVFCLANIVV